MRDEFDVVVVGAGRRGRLPRWRPAGRVPRSCCWTGPSFPGTRPAETVSPRTRLTFSPNWVCATRWTGSRRCRPCGWWRPDGGAVARALPRPAYTVPRQVVRCPAGGGGGPGVEVRADRSASRRIRTVTWRWPSGGTPPAPPGPPAQLIVTSAARWPAYAWSFPIGDGRANVAARCAPITCPCPRSARRRGGAGCSLAGDAFSLINPLTGEGIFYALRSGALAGYAAVGAPEQAARRYATALRRRLGTPSAAQFGVAGLARRRARVFGRVTELGLGDGLLDGRTLGLIALGLSVRHRPPAH